MQFDDTAYLEHHGVLGMKWGVRRYQNKDGSLTSAGKKHRQSMGDSTPISALKKARNGVSELIQLAKKARADKKEAKRISAEEAAKLERERAIKLGDPKGILKYRDTFSDAELKEALNRAKQVSELAKLCGPTKVQKAMAKIAAAHKVGTIVLKDATSILDKAIGYVGTGHKAISTVASDIIKVNDRVVEVKKRNEENGTPDTMPKSLAELMDNAINTGYKMGEIAAGAADRASKVGATVASGVDKVSDIVGRQVGVTAAEAARRAGVDPVSEEMQWQEYRRNAAASYGQRMHGTKGKKGKRK